MVDVGVVVDVVDVVEVEEVDCVLVDVVVGVVAVSVSPEPQPATGTKKINATASTHCLVFFVFCVMIIDSMIKVKK